MVQRFGRSRRAWKLFFKKNNRLAKKLSGKERNYALKKLDRYRSGGGVSRREVNLMTRDLLRPGDPIGDPHAEMIRKEIMKRIDKKYATDQREQTAKLFRGSSGRERNSTNQWASSSSSLSTTDSSQSTNDRNRPGSEQYRPPRPSQARTTSTHLGRLLNRFKANQKAQPRAAHVPATPPSAPAAPPAPTTTPPLPPLPKAPAAPPLRRANQSAPASPPAPQPLNQPPHQAAPRPPQPVVPSDTTAPDPRFTGTPTFAEFAGIFLNDGALAADHIFIALHQKDNEAYARHVAQLIQRIFAEGATVDPGEDDDHVIILTLESSAAAARLQRAGLPSGARDTQPLLIPGWITKEPAHIKACLRGLIDTHSELETIPHQYADGTYYEAKLRITSHAEPLMKFIKQSLTRLSYQPLQLNDHLLILSQPDDLARWADQIGSSSPHLKQQFQTYQATRNKDIE